jgi:hypothetical protein
MENFFYDDRFCSDISDLMDIFDIDEENLSELEDNWMATCEETTFEKMFVLKKEFVLNAILNQTDTWEDRFPEESDDLFKKIEKAIGESIDIEKLNDGIPSLYYPNGKKFIVTKKDLIDYCSPSIH